MAMKLKWTLGIAGEGKYPRSFALLLSHLTPSHISSKDLNSDFIKASIQMGIDCMKGCSTLSVTKRMEMKSLVGHHDTCLRAAEIKKT